MEGGKPPRDCKQSLRPYKGTPLWGGLHLIRQPTSDCHLPPPGKALELFALGYQLS